MKNQRIINLLNYSLAFNMIIVLSGCMQMSESEKDPEASLNGGFEVSRNGLPVNWNMYTPNTVPKSDFKIVMDTINFKEGKQSLRFDIADCQPTGGWMSPGFTNELFNNGAGKYKLSFWVMNHDSEFKMTLSGVTAKGGSDEIVIQSSETLSNWTRFEQLLEVPEDQWLRINLNIIQPGTFWIDDIRIDKL